MRTIPQFIMKRVQGRVLAVVTFLLALTLSLGFMPSNLQRVYAQEENLYLDGQNGNDENDGTTQETAVKSFEKAKQMATENPYIEVIYVVDTVPVAGEVSLDNTNAILMRNPGFSGYLLSISAEEEVTLRNITIDGGGENDGKTTKSLIYLQGDLNIEDGTILENNKANDPTRKSTDFYGGAICSDFNDSHKKVINMTGGIIRDNRSYFGGGICLSSNTTLNMSGGEISNNQAYSGMTYNGTPYVSGGGIAAYRGSTINLSGDALITENSSEEIGGGISLGTIVPMPTGNILNMTGGTISKNTAGSSGGGIYIQCGNGKGNSVANISEGKIIDNAMTGKGNGNQSFGGGGIYVNGKNENSYYSSSGVLNLTNALITNNTATEEGGGYASCPTSNTGINVKNGVAIFGNHSKKAQDIYIEAGYRYGYVSSGSPKYAISSFMLGGTPYNWKNDENEELPINKLEGELSSATGEILGLHSDVTEDAEAEGLAKVIISGNTSATRGGGIGSNGTVNTGEKKVISIKVNKTWKYDNPETRPTSIIVELYRVNKEDPANPIYIGQETITEADDWSISFKNLPKIDENDELYQYTIKEKGAEGYSVKMSGNQTSGFKLVNVPGIILTVEKKWNGESANQVEIKLLADGATKEKVTLTEADQWKHSFVNLPKFDANDGHEIVYTVEETALSGYTSEISGDAANGYIVTNTKTITPPSPTPETPPTPSPRPNRPSTPTPSTPTPSNPTPSTPPTPTVAGESRPTPTPDSSEVSENEVNPELVPQVLGESRPVADNKRDTPTGDSSKLLLWAGFFGLSVLGLAYYGLKRTVKR